MEGLAHQVCSGRPHARRPRRLPSWQKCALLSRVRIGLGTSSETARNSGEISRPPVSAARCSLRAGALRVVSEWAYTARKIFAGEDTVRSTREQQIKLVARPRNQSYHRSRRGFSSGAPNELTVIVRPSGFKPDSPAIFWQKITDFQYLSASPPPWHHQGTIIGKTEPAARRHSSPLSGRPIRTEARQGLNKTARPGAFQTDIGHWLARGYARRPTTAFVRRAGQRAMDAAIIAGRLSICSNTPQKVMLALKEWMLLPDGR